MNSRRPQGEGPDGLPGYVWTDEPPDPTAFPLTLLRAVAERPRCALNTTKVKTAAAAVDSASARGNHPLTPGTARGSASPDDQPKPGPAVKGERSESAAHERSEPMTAERKAPLCASGEAEPAATDPPGRT